MPKRSASKSKSFIKAGKQAGRVLYKGSKRIQELPLPITGNVKLDAAVLGARAAAAVVERAFQPRKKYKLEEDTGDIVQDSIKVGQAINKVRSKLSRAKKNAKVDDSNSYLKNPESQRDTILS